MLTDAAIKALRPRDKMYKVTDRDGMYLLVSPTGALTFRFDYRLNGRRETVIIGRYGKTGVSLARAREKLIEAKLMIQDGISPAFEKRREKRRIKEAKSFGEFGERWLQDARMADSTRAMRRTVFERDILPTFRKRLLNEILPEDLRAMCEKVKARGAPATALHVRDIVKLIFSFAILHGELQDAVWDEVDFENAVWSIPKERMKRSKAHNVYLSQQMLDIFIALKTCAGNSKYVLPSRYDADAPMSRATFNRITVAVVERAKKEGLPLESFTVHDLRRTGSTLLNEVGFNSDWIEKCLAHEDGRSSRGIYNKAEYEHQRRHMMQEWSNLVDAWVAGQKYIPTLYPPRMDLLTPEPDA